MAEAFLRDRIGYRGVDVRSGGFAFDGAQSPSDSVDAMAEYRFDLSTHRSRRIGADDVRAADLVIGMEFDHGRKLAVLAPDRIDRFYTLPEIVDRGSTNPAENGEPLAAWLARLHATRPAHPHLGARREYEVTDPFQRPPRVHRQVADQIEQLSDRLSELLDGPIDVASRGSIS